MFETVDLKFRYVQGTKVQNPGNADSESQIVSLTPVPLLTASGFNALEEVSIRNSINAAIVTSQSVILRRYLSPFATGV